MEFCSKCGGLLLPQKTGSRIILVCRNSSCGRKSTTTKKIDVKISTTNSSKKEKIVVVSKKEQVEALPKTTVQCPKCENDKAFWWMEQTRASDEPPTRFHRCTECGHTWREYE